MKNFYATFIFIGLSIGLIFAQTNSELIHNLKGHRQPINDVAISPDGKFAASGGGTNYSPGELIVWDIESGQIYFKYEDIPFMVKSLDFSPDGKYILTAGGINPEKNFIVWEMRTGKKVKELIGQRGISSFDFSKDGNLMVTGGLNQEVNLWDMNQGRIIGSFLNHVYYITEVSISPDGLFIASAAGQYENKKGELKLWNAQNGQLIYNLGWFGEGHKHAVNSVDFSPDGKYLVSGSEDGTFIIWDVATGKEFKNFTEPYTQITKVRFSPDGSYVATCGKDKTVKIWEIATGKKVTQYRGHLQEVMSIAFDPKGRLLASGGGDKFVKIWRTVPLTVKIENYVRNKVIEWQTRDKYEKTADYQQRVSTENRQKKIQEFTQEAIDMMAQKQVTWEVIQSDYDPDNETFRLTFKDLSALYVKVPSFEAPAFDNQIKALQFKNPHFTLADGDKFALLHVDIVNPVNGKAYAYDSQQYIAFNANLLNLDLGNIEMNVPNYAQIDTENNNPNNNNNNNNNNTNRQVYGISEVDFKLPRTGMNNPDAVAVVIGNSKYQKTKPVNFAISDARSVRNYLTDVMGFKPGNIIYLENASYTDFKLVFGSKGNPQGKLYNTIKPGKSEVFVYYSGHGAPSLKDQQAYFIPVECDPQYVDLTGFPTDVFYDNLAQLPATSVTVVLDACFSGENIYENISPIVIKSKGALGLKNGALLASSEADQVSSWYNEKAHGLFTYFFLKAIHDKNADANRDNQLTLEEIYNFIADQSEGVPYYARRLHGIDQTPVIKGQNPKKVLVNYN
ncbi:MAG: caspase family protein [Microscillaceae bacterium]|nr:caspase family protein [Microscillaceae bacterium]